MPMEVETADEESAQPQRSKMRLAAILTALYVRLPLSDQNTQYVTLAHLTNHVRCRHSFRSL